MSSYDITKTIAYRLLAFSLVWFGGAVFWIHIQSARRGYLGPLGVLS